MKILLSAFEPFNNDKINPSEEIYKNGETARSISKWNLLKLNLFLIPMRVL